VNFFTKAMVSVTGHHLDESTHPEEIGGLSKIGLAICFASLLAAMQFGIAGWYLSEGLDSEARTLFSLVMGMIGCFIVLIIDRNFIYAADTRADISGNLAYFYLAIRVFLILAISSLSSQFILPLLLKSELAIHVQDLKDERYDQAKNRYTNKYEVKEKLETEQSLGAQVNKLKQEINTLPQPIARQRAQADQCMRDYKKKINSSLGPDLDESDVLNLYAGEKLECERLEILFRENYRAYITPRQAALASKEEDYKGAQEIVGQAQTALKGDLKKTDENNQLHLNIASADVLWSLIQANPGARAKYLMITIVQLVLELMPLLLKSLLGRSPLGIRVAMRYQNMHEQYQEAEHAFHLNAIERNGVANKAKNEQTKFDLVDQIEIQEMRNQLMSLKVDTRKKFFDFSPYYKTVTPITPQSRANANNSNPSGANQSGDTKPNRYGNGNVFAMS